MNGRLKYKFGFVGALVLGGCAEPCFDDGLLQEEGDMESCLAMATASGSDSETEGATESDSAGGDCDDGVQNGDETDVDCGG
ncbi:MAG: hypothetical protein KUG77_21450, partial [Nannocystaceae bacterium]|nr:hypothetical protein [Nannocystaceae bacterium]